MALTREEVLKIAKLSKLSFEEKEIEKFQIELINNFREKEEKTSLEITKVLLNAPESAENAIVVPKVVGE